jgi:hypothetical protein
MARVPGEDVERLKRKVYIPRIVITETGESRSARSEQGDSVLARLLYQDAESVALPAQDTHLRATAIEAHASVAGHR